MCSRSLLLALVLLLPTGALAHSVVSPGGGFLNGFWHPVGGLDHTALMMAVGVLAWALRGRARWLVPLGSVGLLAAGFCLSVVPVEVSAVELCLAFLAIALGAAAALGWSLPVGTALGLVALFAVRQGQTHGAELPEASGGLAYLAGFLLASALLHASGIYLASCILGRDGRALTRLLGTALTVGALGLVLLGLTIRA